MEQEQYEHIERMLSQLVDMVGKTNVEQQFIRENIQSIKEEQPCMNEDIQSIKGEVKSLSNKLSDLTIESQNRHRQVLKRFGALEADQNHIWETAARNEREIDNLKQQHYGT